MSRSGYSIVVRLPLPLPVNRSDPTYQPFVPIHFIRLCLHGPLFPAFPHKFNRDFTIWTLEKDQIAKVEISLGRLLNDEDVAIPNQWIKAIASCLNMNGLEITCITVI
jgi:hypothetical protein